MELARVCLSLGDTDTARTALAAVFRSRASEVADHHFAARVLVGDWHLARARALGGLPALDVDFDREYAPRRLPPPDPGRVRESLRRAAFAWSRAAAVGARIDAAYGAPLRAWQLAMRRSHLERTRERLRSRS